MIDRLWAGGLALAGAAAVALSSLSAARAAAHAAHWWASHITAASAWGLGQ